MNIALSKALIMLGDPAHQKLLADDPRRFAHKFSLSDADLLALETGNRLVIKYQARFGDLSKERFRRSAEARALPRQRRLVKSQFGPHARRMRPNGSYQPIGQITRAHQNWLAVVGTGIAISQLTHQASYAIGAADRLLYCVDDAATGLELQTLNPRFESLRDCYGENKPRRDTYKEMADRIVAALNEGHNVCAVFYGHPGFFSTPAHLAIAEARRQGYEAHMAPAPSSLDCLIADLGVELAWGCQVCEATHFLLTKKIPDVESAVILLQVGFVGDLRFQSTGCDARHFPVLVDRLMEFYKPEHEVVLYEASEFSISPPRVDLIPVGYLASATVNGDTTMYIPPVREAARDCRFLEQFVAAEA